MGSPVAAIKSTLVATIASMATLVNERSAPGGSHTIRREMRTLSQDLPFMVLPVAAVMIGGALSWWRSPGPKLTSAAQHFAAGLVLAAVAIELLPEVVKPGLAFWLFVGFVPGVGLLLLLRRIFEGGVAEGEEKQESPVELVTAIGVDVLIDGLLVGIGFAVGAKQGLLLALAITVEVFFLGVCVSMAIRKARHGFGTEVWTSAIPAGLLLIGSIVGSAAGSQLVGASREVLLSFGVAALLFLVAEELLEEAHEVRDTAVVTSMFFAGFLALMLLNLAGA